jgi:hypothetical protein
VNGLDLSTGATRGSTINVPVQQRPGFRRIVPGKPDQSYLYLKIIDDPRATGDIMPQGCPSAPLAGAQCLTADEVEAVRVWILECALGN